MIDGQVNKQSKDKASYMLISGDMQEYELKFRLSGQVDPSKCRHTILKSKLEIVLQKAQNVTWPKLMANEHEQAPSLVPQVPVQQPSYPTSCKRCALCFLLPSFLAKVEGFAKNSRTS